VTLRTPDVINALDYIFIDVAHIIFMENFSENKRKRGRPPKMLDDGVSRKKRISDLEKMGLSTDGKSERAKINNFYQIIAHGALKDQNDNTPIDGEFSFIISSVGWHDIRNYKRTILQELGRLEDPDLIRDVARVICENKLNTMEAVTYIRQFRTGGKSTGDSLNLARVIGKTIDVYILKHSGVNDDMIRDSLNIVLNAFSKNVSNNIEEIDNL